jgi:hypothetical protein
VPASVLRARVLGIAHRAASGGLQAARWLAAGHDRDPGARRPLTVFSRDLTATDRADLEERLRFYDPALAALGIAVLPRWQWSDTLWLRPRAWFGAVDLVTRAMIAASGDVLDLDFRRNPVDGWAWIELAGRGAPRPDLAAAGQRWRATVARWRPLGYSRCYVFGTGASLERAAERDFTDGYRVVCNTIVRDAGLWRHLNPHVIVAGDAIYHFGHTAFARAFRRDLAARLGESETVFLYPSIFDPVVRRELGAFGDRLVPVPRGQHQDVHVDLTRRFEFPALGNVLPQLLLPVATTLASEVQLWGFDGRAPTDRLFWTNSSRHSYPELLPALEAAHPRFFAHYVPTADPGRYVRTYLGDDLENRLQSAERAGFRFVMLHPSWTPALGRRVAAAALAAAPR